MARVGRTSIETLVTLAPFVLAVYLRQKEIVGFRYLVPAAIVLCALLAWVLLRTSGLGWRDVGFGRPAHWGRTVLGGVLTFIAMLAVGALVIRPLLGLFRVAPPDLERLEMVRDSPLTFLILLFPVSWGTAAFGEELVTRGFILNRFATALGGSGVAYGSALLLQAALFGLAHSWQGTAGVISTGVYGLVLGGAFLATGRNLWVPIIAHGLMDSISMIAIYRGG